MEFIIDTHKIYYKENEKELAYVSFPFVEGKDNVVNINSTFVDEALRGKGIANNLLQTLVTALIERQWKAIPTCSYAVKWFEEHPDYATLLEK